MRRLVMSSDPPDVKTRRIRGLSCAMSLKCIRQFDETQASACMKCPRITREYRSLLCYGPQDICSGVEDVCIGS
jgi:hypothetical protein